jgi:hypothetical protein
MERRRFLGLGSSMAGVLFGKRALPASSPRLELIGIEPHPVLSPSHPDAHDIRYGFEGGRALRVNNTYHLFTSEMIGDPIWVKMRLGHWSSPDGLRWKRVGTLYQSSGEYTGRDPRASLWSPMPIWDGATGRWNLFYVAYRSAPNSSGQFRLNYDGHIWRAESKTAGIRGIGGPYRDMGVVLEPEPSRVHWEGLQGADSFFPYQVGTKWMALYGSAKTEHIPITSWQVGLAYAPTLAGPWRRVEPPVPAGIEPTFIENPIVERLPSGEFLAVYDSDVPNCIGYTSSVDGRVWRRGDSLRIQDSKTGWAKDVRTPLGLIPERGDEYTVFYTGFVNPPDWKVLLDGNGDNSICSVGKMRLRLV